MVQFFTLAYFEELAERLNADEEWRKKASDLTTKIVATCTDREFSVLLDIQQGAVTVREVSPEEPSDFKLEGAYDAWVATGKGEADLQTSVMRGKIRFKGSMSKIMGLMGQLNRLVAVLRDMPKEF